MKIVFIGMGGTNSWLVKPSIQYLLSEHQNEWLDVVIVDGDSYSESNLTRQEFNPEFVGVNKAEAKVLELETIFQNSHNIEFQPVKDFLHKDNMVVITDYCIVFMAVDCMKTRRLVDEHCGKLNNILLMSLGNELNDGDVQFMYKVNGIELSPSIGQGHPEVSEADNVTRSDMTCEEQASLPGGGQLICANIQGATIALSLLHKILSKTELLSKENGIGVRGVYYDNDTLAMRSIPLQ